MSNGDLAFWAFSTRLDRHVAQVGTESVVPNCGSPAERGYRNISASVGASAYNGEQLRCSKQRDRAGLWAQG